MAINIKFREKTIEEAYNDGLKDAWETARKIIRGEIPYDYWEMGSGHHISNAIKRYSAIEAIEKIKKYERQKHSAEEAEIKIGDEVICPLINNSRGIVVQKLNDTIKILSPDMGDLLKTQESKVLKTGRNFPQITEVLKSL